MKWHFLVCILIGVLPEYLYFDPELAGRAGLGCACWSLPTLKSLWTEVRVELEDVRWDVWFCLLYTIIKYFNYSMILYLEYGKTSLTYSTNDARCVLSPFLLFDCPTSRRFSGNDCWVKIFSDYLCYPFSYLTRLA